MSDEIRSAFDAAADSFDADPLSFWKRIGRRTIDQIQLNHGDQVLDVGCGAGASAFPAAGAVGPFGRVIALDISEQLLALGRQQAVRQGIRNIDFCCEDMTELDYPDQSMDAVVSVLSIFFVDDMEMQIRRLWSLLKPGGTLAVTCWGPCVLEPAMSAWMDIVGDVRPDLYTDSSPGGRISRPKELQSLFRAGGARDVTVIEEPGSHLLKRPADWWDIVLGSGLRGVMEEMSEREFALVKARTLNWADQVRLSSLELNVLYGRSTKPTHR